MNLLLFGFKGSGKSRFGKKLAAEMKRPFIDTDDLICELYAEEKGERLPIGDIYRALGAEGFRTWEKEAVFSLENIKASVIALGGGAILDEENRIFLEKQGILVYLKANPQTLRERMRKAAFLDPNNWEESFRNLIQERIPLYEAVNCPVVDVDQLDEPGVLAKLRSLLIF